MKAPVFFIAILSCLCIQPAFSLKTGNSGPGRTLKVMTYNIHHCNPPSLPEGQIDVPAIAKVINDAKPDFVALQEVDVNTERSGKGKNQARELAQLTGMYFYFAKAIDHQGGDYGVAVLSKFPVLDSLQLPLPLPAEVKGEPRTVAAVKVRIPGGKKIWFASTHLDLKEETRLFQSDIIIKRLGSRKEPVILAGDFNAVPTSPVIALLDKTFTRTCIDDCLPTSPHINPRRTIDFIMFTAPKRISAVKTSVIEETYASDHRPVVAELAVK